MKEKKSAAGILLCQKRNTSKSLKINRYGNKASFVNDASLQHYKGQDVPYQQNEEAVRKFLRDGEAGA
jgi:hypothetical protein